MIAEWAYPALSLVSLPFWLVAIRNGLRYVAADVAPPSAFRLVLLSVAGLVVGLLTVSSLAYPHVITNDASRACLGIVRIALLLGGIAAWWSVRGTPRWQDIHGEEP